MLTVISPAKTLDFSQQDIVTDYSSALAFHISEIDMARDIVNAFEYAILNSEEKIVEFNLPFLPP